MENEYGQSKERASTANINPKEAPGKSKRWGKDIMEKSKAGMGSTGMAGKASPKSTARFATAPREKTPAKTAKAKTNESEQSKRASITDESPSKASTDNTGPPKSADARDRDAAAKSKQLSKTSTQKHGKPGQEGILTVPKSRRRVKVVVTQCFTRARSKSNQDEEPNPTCCST